MSGLRPPHSTGACYNHLFRKRRIDPGPLKGHYHQVCTFSVISPQHISLSEQERLHGEKPNASSFSIAICITDLEKYKAIEINGTALTILEHSAAVQDILHILLEIRT